MEVLKDRVKLFKQLFRRHCSFLIFVESWTRVSIINMRVDKVSRIPV